MKTKTFDHICGLPQDLYTGHTYIYVYVCVSCVQILAVSHFLSVLLHFFFCAILQIIGQSIFNKGLNNLIMLIQLT